jgi:hypothetical protein
MIFQLPSKSVNKTKPVSDVWYAWFPVLTQQREIVWFELVLRTRVKKWVCADHGWIESGFKYKYERWLSK